MITSIRLVNFKNFADETLRVGPFTVIVGANASGKSNIRDAFRVLHGIGRGYTLAEIFGGKREAGWQPIRGAMNEIVRFGEPAFMLEVELDLTALKLDEKKLHYAIEVGRDETTGAFHVRKEELRDESAVIYTSVAPQEKPRVAVTTIRWAPDVKGEHYHGADRPALTEALSLGSAKDNEDLPSYQKMKRLHHVLDHMRFLELSPERMREPAFPGATVLGDSGEHLPTVLQAICTDPKRKEILADWLSELTPMDVAGFEYPVDPSGRVHLMLCEANGRKVSAYSASDGTLRFLAMLAALLFGDTSSGLYFFEEMDTGIHPARQWLLLDLIEQQTAKRGVQVVTTTHSPDLLTFVNDSTFEHLSVVCRLEDAHDAIIRPVAKLPNAGELRTAQGGLGRLLSSRWMETALAFTEDYDEAEDGS